VELLVAIAIIAVLIAILMPAFARARIAAVRLQCMNNHRQMMLGLIQYTYDNQGLIPPPMSYAANGSQNGCWYSMCWLGVYIGNTVDRTTWFTNNNSKFAVCPAYATAASWDSCGIGMNACWDSGIWKVKYNKIIEPARTVLFVDVRNDSSGYMSNLLEQLYRGDAAPRSWSGSLRLVTYRHGKQTVASFVDGHVEPFASQFEDWESTQYKQGLHRAYVEKQIKYTAQ
jgi:prepilin-type processing-associated H-X9-DG protein